MNYKFLLIGALLNIIFFSTSTYSMNRTQEEVEQEELNARYAAAKLKQSKVAAEQENLDKEGKKPRRNGFLFTPPQSGTTPNASCCIIS